MRMSSTTTTRIGRRSESGRCTRSILTSLLVGWLSSALGAAASAGEAVHLTEGQVHAARVQAMTTVCGEEAPAVAAQMKQAPSEWLERNPAIVQEALHALYFGLDAKVKLAAYEALRLRL